MSNLDNIIFEQYISIEPANAEYRVYLKVDGQAFCVTPVPCDLEEATFMREMLAEALCKIIKEIRVEKD